MTTRAVLLGLLGATFMCAFTYFNDHVIRQTWLIFSSTPTAVYGALIILLLAVNPLLKRIRQRWQFTGAELAVALALTLIPCCIPGAGLMETFPNAIMMPHHAARTEPAWKAEGAIEMAPPVMLADVSQDEDRALNGYVQGLSTGGKQVPVGDVPWGAWTRTLWFWIPAVLLLWGGLIGLALVVHKQWSDHEKLPYPIATFTEALLPPEARQTKPVYLQRTFLIGCAVVCFVHLTNFIFAWFPEHTVAIPRTYSMRSLVQLFPTLERSGGGRLFGINLIFTVIGLSYFLPRDMSFSLGIGPFAYYYVAGVLAGYGIATGGGGWYEMNLQRSMQAGAYAGLMLVIIYTGRRYYASVFRAAFGMRSPDPVEPHAVWGARAFLACTVLFAVVLMAIGLDWPLAILYTLLIVVGYALIGRLSAETGFIFIQLWWEPAAFLVALLGVRAVGPTAALIMFLLSSALMLDTRESLTPFVLNSLRVLRERKVAVGKVAALGAGALVLGLAIAVPSTLYIKYDRGTNLSYNWATVTAPKYAFNEAVKIKQRLRTQGELERAETQSGFGRIFSIAPSKTLIVGFAIAFAVFLLLTFARLRVPWWPIHPVLMLVWATYPGARFASSYLIGFVLKTAIVKYGGDKAYQRLKPMMIGLIAGDMLFGILTSFVGGIYYLATGSPPPRFSVFW